MLNPRHKSPHSKPNFWGSLRFQLSGALFFAVIFPIAFLAGQYENFFELPTTKWAVSGIIIASIFSVYLNRTLSLYPGIRGAFFSFPSVLGCFALTFSLFLLFRVDYSRALLLSGAVGTLAWLYLVHVMVGRGPALSAGIVPFGNVGMLSELPTLEIKNLTKPKLTDHFDILVADFHADLPDEWEAFLADCALSGIPVLHVKQLHEALSGRVAIEHLSENSFGSLIPFIGYLRLRRAFDFASALAALILFFPIMILVGVIIKLDSPGPALFRQERIGYRGMSFRIAKFRTMVAVRPHTDLRSDAFTHDKDPRITRVGRFLRRSRIDELPQIFNILKGEMSWIGPRPEAEALSHWYESELPFYRYRHIVPPGITGWAQVNQGHVFELDQVMSKLQYDFYYIKNFSPWLDALIAVRTVQTVITGFGSR